MAVAKAMALYVAASGQVSTARAIKKMKLTSGNLLALEKSHKRQVCEFIEAPG